MKKVIFVAEKDHKHELSENIILHDITFENLILICGTELSDHILPFKFTEQMSRNTA